MALGKTNLNPYTVSMLANKEKQGFTIESNQLVGKDD